MGSNNHSLQSLAERHSTPPRDYRSQVAATVAERQSCEAALLMFCRDSVIDAPNSRNLLLEAFELSYEQQASEEKETWL